MASSSLASAAANPDAANPPSTEVTHATLAALASSLASNPLASFAAGSQANSHAHQAAAHALQHIFALSVATEPGAAPHIVPFLHTIHPEPAASADSASRKRKRGGKKAAAAASSSQPLPNKHSLFPPTPLDRLVTENMDPDQLWAQLELRTASMHKMINALIVTEDSGGGNRRSGSSSAQADLDDDDDDDENEDWTTDDEEEDSEDDDDSADDSSDVELEPDSHLALVDASANDSDDEDWESLDQRSEQENQDPSLNGALSTSSPAPLRRTIRVRFHEQVAVRQIQPRKVRDDEEDDDDDDSDDDEDGEPGIALTPELLQLLSQGKLTEEDLRQLSQIPRQPPQSSSSKKRAGARNAASSSKSAMDQDDEQDEYEEDEDEDDDDDNDDDEQEEEEAESDVALGVQPTGKAKQTFTLNADEDDHDEDFDEDGDLGIDLFAPLPDDDAGEDEALGAVSSEDRDIRNAADARYADFFGKSRPDSMKNGKRAQAEERRPSKRPRMDQQEAGDKEAQEEPVAIINGGSSKSKGKGVDLADLGFPEEDDLDADLDESEDEEEDEDEDDDMELDDEDEEQGAFNDEATAARVASDLFADEPQPKGAEALSRFEKRQAALRDEIAALERENVSKKDWTLRGEIGAPARPVNSLLEEDLEFEQSMKRAPVITEATTSSLEDRIKARILENRFDDVERRYPQLGSMNSRDFLPSRMLELSDAKSGKSLAELYEEEYQQKEGDASGSSGTTLATGAGAEADRKLANEHQVIAGLFDEVCGKLDALSNAHYTPKAPKATIQTLTNAASISLESALPTHAGSAAATMLAPEEVFEPARGSSSTALVGSRSEMTPEQKQVLHDRLRREKKKRNERIEHNRKAVESVNGGGTGSKNAGSKKGEKEAKEAALKKLIGNKGVSVIGKDGKNRTGKEALGNGKAKGAKQAHSKKAAAEPSDAALRSGSKLKL
ncbi:U3 snoRNP protein [Tilletia horrida]|nr:U3 snoRNP protein [Tilletia horrida]